MAIQIRASLSIRQGNLSYQSSPSGFTAAMAGEAGPTPGDILVTGNTPVNLSGLDVPGGWARILNKDPTNYVEIGLTINGDFYPIHELLPGEQYVARLSRWLGQEAPGTGTGTAYTGSVQLTLRTIVAPVRVLFEAFDA